MFDQYSNSSDTKGLSERFSTESKSGQWLGLFPLYGLQSFFLILMLQGRLFPSSNSENIWLPSTIFFLVMIVFLVAYVIGWKEGFPRWWFGFPLCLILISTFLQQSEGPDGVILAWRAWIPFGLATFIAVLISLFPSRYHKLRQGIWQDQVPGALLGLSLLTFAMLMPVMILEFVRLIRNRKRFDANLFNGTKTL